MAARRSARARRALWAYATGKYGFTVRVFERADRPTLTLAYWDPAVGRIRKRGLGHADRDRARDEAEHVAQQLRSATRPGVAAPIAAANAGPLATSGATHVPTSAVTAAAGVGGFVHRPDGPGWPAGAARDTADPHAGLTFTELFAHYAAAKVDRFRLPAEYRRRIALWQGFLDGEGVVRVADIDATQLETFADRRRYGDLQVAGLKLRPPAPPAKGRERRTPVVSERTIGADVEFLMGVLAWATRRKVDGVHLLAAMPFAAPRHRTPERGQRRPLATEEDHRALLRVADRVDRAQGLFGCFLRVLHDLGWRVTAVCHIRASDLDLRPGRGRPYGAVRKNPLVDKEEIGDWVPLSRHARATVGRLLRRGGIAAGHHVFLFPAPRAAGQPWSRYHVRDLLERAEAAARVAHVGGAHAWRRKWATERKAHPEVDVMHAGGWRDPRTLRTAYTRPDVESTYEVVSQRTGVVRRGDYGPA